MHYCQSCERPTPMEPDQGRARCPECGRVDEAAAIEPGFVVTGASGAGKTAIFPTLVRLLRGRCVTFDVDWLLDAAGVLSGGRPTTWPGLRDTWLSVVLGVAQAGMPTALLGPLIPEHFEALPARRWVGEIHYLVLDCTDDERRRRIEARPAWRSRDIDEQVRFGQWLRGNIPDRVHTTNGTPEEAAAAVAEWVTRHL